MCRCGIIILAAGASRRYGQPKQLLPFRGRSLLRNAVETALDSPCDPVIVVTGANAERVELEVSGLRALIARNDNWPQGMGTSIRCGIQAIFRAEQKQVLPTAGAIVMFCDQPFVTAAFLRRLVRADGLRGKEIVAAQYDGIAGAPVYFSRTLYPELLTVAPDRGARGLILQFPEKVHSIPFAGAGFDVDTPEDFQSILARDPQNRLAPVQGDVIESVERRF
jgi:molybdenum cofactor cytidylyltransferase